MFKKFLFLFTAFLFGLAGGIFSDQIVWPWLLGLPAFSRPPIYLKETREIRIQENEALQNAISRVEKAAFAVTNPFSAGSGLIVTNDGLVLTLSTIAPPASKLNFYVEGKSQTYQILKRDTKLNLALAKLDASNLVTTGFAEIGSLRLGQRVFLVTKGLDSESVNEGIITAITPDRIETNIKETSSALGSPIFNIEGNLIGLANLAKDGSVWSLPIDQIKNFAGL